MYYTKHGIPVDLGNLIDDRKGIARRVERAKQLMEGGGDLSMAEVAACAGFSDQSHFSQHFKRLVGVTPGQFRIMTARTA